MRYLMYSQKQILVGRSSNGIRRQKEWPGEDGHVLEKVGACYLNAYHGENEWDCQRLGSTKLEDLRMSLDDCLPSRLMRFFRVCPKEAVVRVGILGVLWRSLLLLYFLRGSTCCCASFGSGSD